MSNPLPKFAFFFLFIFCVSFSAKAQEASWIPPEKTTIDTIIQVMYNMEFVKAEKLIKSYQNRYPWRPEGPFIEGMILWTQILVDMWNPYLDDQFQKKMDYVINICEKMEKVDSIATLARYYKSGAVGFKARAYGNRDQWFAAARYGFKALNGIEDAIDGKFKNIDAQFGAGLYFFYAAVIPDDYPFVKPLLWFYPKGDKEKGVQLLQLAADSGLFTQTEAKYFLGTIYDSYLNNPQKAWTYFKELSDKYPQNARFLFRRGAMAYKSGNYWDADSAMAVIDFRIRRGDPLYYQHQYRYIGYYRGVIAESRGKFDLALSFYNDALRPVDQAIEKETEHYYVYCMLRSADMLRRLGNEDDAVKRFQTVLTLPDYSDSRNRAKKALDIYKN